MAQPRLLTALSGLLLAAGLGHAQTYNPTPEALEKARLINAKCLECHVEAALKQPPKANLDLKKLRSVILDPTAFKGSSHARLACTKCHTEGYTEHPHADDAKDMTNTCDDCHSKQVRQIEAGFEKSVHAVNLADTFTCLNCHDPHVMQSAKNLKDPQRIVAQDNRVCLGCHDSDETFARFAPEKKNRPPIDDLHAWLPNARMHWRAVRCIECHTAPGEGLQSHEIVKKDRAEKKCVACHSADSRLLARLYRYLATEEERRFGFLNGALLGDVYVVGATRNPTLDFLVVSLVALTLAGVLVHGLLRFIAARLRRSRRHD
jgi:predicted CXXCH cytochrome family protein